jgi:acyl-CoA thioesterase
MVNQQATPHEVGAAMRANDTASFDTMGMQLLQCDAGSAVMQMRVTAKHLNGHHICHGGFIFTLADSTFAFACNSHNVVAVAASAHIEFLKPAQLDDLLTCTGTEQVLQGRHGVYDMRVTNQHGEVVALFRGKSAQLGRPVVEPSYASQKTVEKT